MTEPISIDSNTLNLLNEAFKVYSGTYYHYEDFYNFQILPRLREKYLAHLVASIEEIIDEKIKAD